MHNFIFQTLQVVSVKASSRRAHFDLRGRTIIFGSCDAIHHHLDAPSGTRGKTGRQLLPDNQPFLLPKGWSFTSSGNIARQLPYFHDCVLHSQHPAPSKIPTSHLVNLPKPYGFAVGCNTVKGAGPLHLVNRVHLKVLC